METILLASGYSKLDQFELGASCSKGPYEVVYVSGVEAVVVVVVVVVGGVIELPVVVVDIQDRHC